MLRILMKPICLPVQCVYWVHRLCSLQLARKYPKGQIHCSNTNGKCPHQAMAPLQIGYWKNKNTITKKLGKITFRWCLARGDTTISFVHSKLCHLFIDVYGTICQRCLTFLLFQRTLTVGGKLWCDHLNVICNSIHHIRVPHCSQQNRYTAMPHITYEIQCYLERYRSSCSNNSKWNVQIYFFGAL